MKKTLTLFFAAALTANCVHAQNTFPVTGSAGIGTAAPNASSLLEMVSTSKGLLIPRMTVAQRNAIISPATGLMIFQTNNTPGFYYYSGTAWNAVSSKSANQTLSNLTAPTAINQSLVPAADNVVDIGSPTLNWRNLYLQGGIYLGGSRILNLNGNNSSVGFGTLYNLSLGYGNTAVGNSALALTTNGNRNTATGHLALYSNTTGSWNAAHGAEALYANTTGEFNTANGFYALNKNTTGDRNTANGSYSMYNNTTGRLNSAVGVDALFANTTGSANVANGFEALHDNTTGYSNVGIGVGTLRLNTTASNLVAIGDSALYNNGGGLIYPEEAAANTAIGSKSLFSNGHGYFNSALGYWSLYANTQGSSNTACGVYALRFNTIGSFNTAMGQSALASNTEGNFNIGIGNNAQSANTMGSFNTSIGNSSLYYNTTGSSNTAVGYNALVNNTGSYNSALGYGAGNNYGVLLTNTTALGSYAKVTANNSIQLGDNSVTSVKAGNNIIIVSDGRFKKNLKENVPGLEFINQLKPVTYNYDIHKLNDYIKPASNAATEKGNSEKPENPELEKIKEDAITAKEKKIYTGFVAQDVEKIADKMGYDFSGVYKPQNDKDPYGLSYADFVVPLVKAVQELSKANDALQQQNTDLEKRMQQLEAMMNVQSSATSNAQTVKIISAALEQNIPNPFNHSTTINYTLPQQCSNAKIVITDNAGKSLKEINITGKIKGSVTVDASSLSSGTYYYSLYADGKIISSKQMVLAK